METQVPRSPYEQVGEMVYFGRMVDKIRLHQAGVLRPDLIPNLGVGFDGTACEFLQIDYGKLVERVAAGGSDEEILEWCFAGGFRPGGHLVELWNFAMTRRGWRDRLEGRLRGRLEEGGFAGNADAMTMFDYIDLDEGRNPAEWRKAL